MEEIVCICGKKFKSLNNLYKHNGWTKCFTYLSKKQKEKQDKNLPFDKICPKCNFEIKAGKRKHFEKCDGTGSRRLNKRLTPSEAAKEVWKRPGYKNKMKMILKESAANNPNYGKGSTEEIRLKKKQKHSISILKRYANGEEFKCGRAPKINYSSAIAGEIKLDGSWELAAAKYFDFLKINWIRNKQRFEYFNTLTNKISTYCPDFYLPDEKIYIEIKGYETDLDQCKWNQFKYKLEIWRKDTIKLIMEICSSGNENVLLKRCKGETFVSSNLTISAVL